jgi:hypothetical protein
LLDAEEAEEAAVKAQQAEGHLQREEALQAEELLLSTTEDLQHTAEVLLQVDQTSEEEEEAVVVEEASEHRQSETMW